MNESESPSQKTSSLGNLLIVDDEKYLLDAICTSLSEMGYVTVGFSDGSLALEAMKEQHFDLLLTDLLMPGIDGIEMQRKALEIDPRIACIIMTGQGTVDSAVEAMKSGAVDYILKPFRLRSILPILNRALDLRRLRIENVELNKSLKLRSQELETVNKELEAFAYSASHDLKAPLRSISNTAVLLVESLGSDITPEANALLDRILEKTDNMGILIDELLRVSRLGRKALKKELIDIGQLVHEILEEWKRDHLDGGIEVEVGKLPSCHADKDLLKQVFINLLSNAFKFTSNTKTPQIEVDFKENDSDPIYFIRDNGAGFDMNESGRLFGVFQRLHDSEQYEGNGIGLSIVQRIVQRHGGQVWAEGAVNQGATFYFTLPCE